MGQRIIRVNALVHQEISLLMHTRFQAQTIFITITEVSIAPDLRTGKVYYSVIGDAAERKKAEKFFRQNAHELRKIVSKRIVLKYIPFLTYYYDDSIERGVEVVDLIDEISEDENSKKNQDA